MSHCCNNCLINNSFGGTFIALWLLCVFVFYGIFMKLIVIASLLLGVSFSSSASFLHTDYLVEGDSKASLDTDTGIEWLKLPNTQGMSLDEIYSKTSRKGVLFGWRLPSHDEVADLMSKLYRVEYRNNGSNFVAGSSRFENDIAKNTKWFNVMGTNNRYSYVYDRSKPRAYKSYSYGIAVSDDGSLRRSGYYSEERYYYGSDLTFEGGVNYSSSQGTNASDSYFLVSDGGVTLSSKINPSLNENNPNAPVNDVPVGMLFSALSLLGIGFMSKNRRKQTT